MSGPELVRPSPTPTFRRSEERKAKVFITRVNTVNIHGCRQHLSGHHRCHNTPPCTSARAPKHTLSRRRVYITGPSVAITQGRHVSLLLLLPGLAPVPHTCPRLLRYGCSFAWLHYPELLWHVSDKASLASNVGIYHSITAIRGFTR